MKKLRFLFLFLFGVADKVPPIAYWKTFDPFVIPLLEKPMDLRRSEELVVTDKDKTVEGVDADELKNYRG